MLIVIFGVILVIMSAVLARVVEDESVPAWRKTMWEVIFFIFTFIFSAVVMVTYQ